MKRQTYKVLDVTFHCQAEPDGSTVMEVRYRISRDRTISEYLNFENTFDRMSAAEWWSERSNDPVPKTNQHAVDSANYHALALTLEIAVEYYHFGYRFDHYTLSEKPPDKDDAVHNAAVCKAWSEYLIDLHKRNEHRKTR